MKFYWLTLGALAVWRVTHILNAEDGPGDAFVRMRNAIGKGFWGDLLDCFYCLSLWIALPFAYWLGDDWKERLLLWPALSAAAILAERMSSRADNEKHTALYFEAAEPNKEESQNVMLRTEESGCAADGHPDFSTKSRV